MPCTPGQQFDLRRSASSARTISYSSSLDDLAFVMQGLGTYAIVQAATEQSCLGLARAANGKPLAAFAGLNRLRVRTSCLNTTARREDEAT